MPQFEIEVLEVHAIKYTVDADDTSSAIRKVLRGQAEYDEESLRYVHQRPPEEWQVREVGCRRAEGYGITPPRRRPRAETRGSEPLPGLWRSVRAHSGV